MWNYLLFSPLKRQITCFRQERMESHITPSAEAWLDLQCRKTGSSLQERKRLAMGILSKRNRLPVLTSLQPFTLYFPWKHPEAELSCWINRARVNRVDNRFSKALITFSDGEQLEVPDARRLCSTLSSLDVLALVLQPASLGFSGL